MELDWSYKPMLEETLASLSERQERLVQRITGIREQNPRECSPSPSSLTEREQEGGSSFTLASQRGQEGGSSLYAPRSAQAVLRALEENQSLREKLEESQEVLKQTQDKLRKQTVALSLLKEEHASLQAAHEAQVVSLREEIDRLNGRAAEGRAKADSGEDLKLAYEQEKLLKRIRQLQAQLQASQKERIRETERYKREMEQEADKQKRLKEILMSAIKLLTDQRDSLLTDLNDIKQVSQTNMMILLVVVVVVVERSSLLLELQHLKSRNNDFVSQLSSASSLLQDYRQTSQ
ncbi:hypothetical protein GUITHDRAFT_149674, partial [Guillardia theta CCMP2712]